MAATVSRSAATTRSEEQRVVLYEVSWETYEHLLGDYVDQPAPRLTYDRGTMEMLVNLSTRHERTKTLLTSMVEIVADIRGVDFLNVGSMTFRRKDLQRGFEPDVTFYFQNESLVRRRDQIDLAVDPPPDLVIEIDVSRQSLNKLSIYAAFGVSEVWRVQDGAVTIYTLRADDSGAYDAGKSSQALPPLDGKVLTQFLAASAELGRAAWVRSVREWASTVS